MLAGLPDGRPCILNLHCPPYASGLDDAPELDATLKPGARAGGAHASQPSVIASRSACPETLGSWIKMAEYPSKCGIVKKAAGFAASTASFSARSSTRTAR